MSQNNKGISPLVDQGGDIDVKELSRKIQKRVEEKLRSGFYDEKEVQGVTNMKLDTSGRDISWLFYNKQKADAVYSLMEENWDVTKPIDTSSPRGGVKGKLISLYKKLYKRLIQPNLNISLSKQAVFNSETTHYVYHLKEAALRAEEEFHSLRDRYLNLSDRILEMEENFSRVENLEGRIDGTDKRLDSFTDKVKALSVSLRDVDKQGIFLKRKMTTLLESLGTGNGGPKPEVIAREREKLNSFDYTLFENLHRGSREEIKSRFNVYIDWFKAASPVVDIGCGRGELIELFTEKGIETKGVDLNDEMVAECKDRGLDVSEGDALQFLESFEDNSLGGVSAIQFIEHLPNDAMIKFFETAYSKLKPGGIIAAETVNPTCLSTFCGAFYLDMSHDKPIHPLAVHFVLERIGFSSVRIEYLNPFPADHKLKKIEADNSSEIGFDIVSEYNVNVDKLNGILYSHQDYAVVAIK